MDIGVSANRSHFGRCLWFWAWAVVGGVFAFGLDVVIVLPLAGLLAWPLLISTLRRRSVWGALTGAGVPILWVAHVQFNGGGLNPWPWLVIGVGLIVGGFVADAQGWGFPAVDSST